MKDPRPSGQARLDFTSIQWEPGVVTCRFIGGHETRGDWGSLIQDRREWYEGVVRLCGYGDRVAAYAVHHDFCHLWLPERVWRVPSPTLEAVAKGRPAPPINRSEEYLVNTVQWTLATGRRDWHREYLRQIIGDEWEVVLDDLQADLDALAEQG